MARDSKLSFKPALNSKGLRQLTHGHIGGAVALRLQASPEFKGIKTVEREITFEAALRFKPALNSKGLRRFISIS